MADTPSASTSSSSSPSSPPPPSSSSPRPKSTPTKLDQVKQWLPLYLHKADVTVSHLNRILSTSAGTETVLLTLNYTLLTLVRTLEIYSRRRIKQVATGVASTAVAIIATEKGGSNNSSGSSTAAILVPGQTVITTNSSSGRMLQLHATTQRLRALTDLISDVRIFVRLWGLLRIWQWAAQTWRHHHHHRPATSTTGEKSQQDEKEDGVLKTIIWTQITLNVLYQALENAAYLAQHNILPWSPRRQTRAWLWSSRCWAAHVILDLARLYRLKTTTTTTKDDNNSTSGQWHRQLLINTLYLPLTLHWSLENGLFGRTGASSAEENPATAADLPIGLLGSVAGWLSFLNLWRETK